MVTSQLLRLRRPDGQALGGVMIWFMFRQQRKTGPNETGDREEERQTDIKPGESCGQTRDKASADSSPRAADGSRSMTARSGKEAQKNVCRHS